MIVAAVGKSGPFIADIKSITSASGLSISIIVPSITSPKLWGGILVAIPTAIPDEPLTNKFGNLDGNTAGSFSSPSKFGIKSTVFLLISLSIWLAILFIFASVYLIAAALSPSTDPKLPWPSTSIYLIEKSWAILTKASYTEVSPCGWYLPNTSPTILAHFLYPFSGAKPNSCIENSILLWTGFNPSLTSGSARPTITLIA